MKKNRYILFLSIIIVFVSCNSYRNNINTENKFSDNFDMNELNGIYMNAPLKGTKAEKRSDFNYNSLSLSSIIFDPYVVFSEPSKIQINYEGKIKIKVLNEKEIEFTHIVGDSIIQQKILKGKKENNHFKVKRKNIQGIPIIWGGFCSNKIFLSYDDNQNLNILFEASYQGVVLIFIIGNKNIYVEDFKFKRINKNKSSNQ
ncbi:hypothetical protein LJC28_02805 [Dysgonomonas sp. OttesenSCG-928-D17]|nr:hypothetical protein [Dysgonomonas sp. OttesenSCG-928-D17]